MVVCKLASFGRIKCACWRNVSRLPYYFLYLRSVVSALIHQYLIIRSCIREWQTINWNILLLGETLRRCFMYFNFCTDKFRKDLQRAAGRWHARTVYGMTWISDLRNSGIQPTAFRRPIQNTTHRSESRSDQRQGQATRRASIRW